MGYYGLGGRGDAMYGYNGEYSVGDYYQGDYYQGDYYQGDPGFFSGIGSLLGKVARGVGGLLPGPFGVVGKVVGSALAPSPRPQLPIPPFGGQQLLLGAGPKEGQQPVLVGGGMAGVPLRPPLTLTPRGMHPNKYTYVTRGGGTSRWPRQLLVHPQKTENVPNRHMNYGNGRALRRALRRARGFARLARSAGFIQRSYKKKGAKKKR